MPNSPATIKVCTNREGTNVLYEHTAGDITYTQVQRDRFYINGAQSILSQSMYGSITEISIANNLITWDEASNYTDQRSILDADIIKHCSWLMPS